MPKSTRGTITLLEVQSAYWSLLESRASHDPPTCLLLQRRGQVAAMAIMSDEPKHDAGTYLLSCRKQCLT